LRIDIVLLPAQAEFIQAKEPEVLYSGAFGAGKSRGGCYKLLTHAIIPGNFVGLCRKKHTTLRQTTLRTLLKPEGNLPPVLPEGTYTHNRSEQVIHLHGGGDIYHFGFDEETRLGSLNFGACFVDEAIELDREEYEMLLGRIRNVADPNRQLFMATNPGSPGHFLYRRFALGGRPKRGRRVIHTTSLDNVYLPKDYLKSLKTLSGTAYDRYVLGKWVAYEGAVYPMFSARQHVRAYKGPWDEAILSVDWGFTHPFVLLVMVRIAADTIYVAEEIVERGLTSGRMTRYASGMLDRYPVYGVACDPSEPAMIAAYQEAGVPADRADNDVMMGIRAVQERLVGGKLLISPNCPNLIKGLQTYQWKKDLDEPVKVADDEVDALRYGVTWWDAHMAVAANVEDAILEPVEEGVF